MKLKKLISVLAITALVAGTLAGCGGDKAPAGDAAPETIKIGINYELSGDVATYGLDSVTGIEMAFEEINAAGGIDGKQIEILKQDNKSDPAEATSLATKLMTQQGAVIVLGPATSGRFKATVPTANANSVAVISASTTADDVTVDKDGNVQEFAFRTCFTDSFQGTAMANFAMRNFDAKTAVIIMDSSSDYAKGLAKNFKATFTAAGGTIVDEAAYVAKDTEFNPILTKLKGKSFDVIFLPGYYQEAGLVIKQARAQGINVPILGADGFDSPVLLELAGPEALSNVYFSNHYSSLDKDPIVTDFIEKFKAGHDGKEPNGFIAMGYDLGNLVADAIKRAGSADPVAIKDALASTKDFAGVTGTLTMDEFHNPIKSVVVIEMQNGQQASSIKVGP